MGGIGILLLGLVMCVEGERGDGVRGMMVRMDIECAVK